MLDHPTDAGSEGDFWAAFDPRVRLGFHGSKISSDGGLLLSHELDETLWACMTWQCGRCGIRGGARTGFITLSVCCASPLLDDWPDTLMSATPIGWPVIQ